MYVDNGVVEIIISIIMGLKINFETHHHELFLSTLNQLIQMSPVKVKQICSSVEDFKSSLISLRDSYTDESKHQARYNVMVFRLKLLTNYFSK